MTTQFAVTWDYRCPFARNAHTHVIAALEAGGPFDVRFIPFSLGQVHVKEGEPDVWENPEAETGLLALQAGVVVRDEFPEAFLAVHRDLFAARHDEGLQLNDREVVTNVLERHVDAAKVLEVVASGEALAKVRAEHTEAASTHGVWGVPTFVFGDQAVFVRLMSRADPENGTGSVDTIERLVTQLAEWPDLNEYKHTTIPR
jgi:predicted DsbA family dithiol-disulfide isomerase